MSERVTGNQYNEVSDEFWSKKSISGQASFFDPLGYFRTILKYKWPIVLITGLVTALGVAYVLSAEPLYRSTQSLLLESSESNIVAIENLVTDAPKDEGYVQTRIEMLKSRDLAQRVIDSLKLLDEPVFLQSVAKHARVDLARLQQSRGTKQDPAVAMSAVNDSQVLSEPDAESLAISYFLSRVEVSQVPTTRLVRISFLSADRQLAARIANEVGLQYIRAYLESNKSMVNEVSGWLDVKLEELKTTLDESEERFLAFKKENQLIDVNGSVGRITEQELLQSSSELTDARMQLSNARIVLDQLDSASSTADILKVLPATRSDPLVQKTRSDISRVITEINRQSTKYGQQHPRMIDLQTELDSLQDDLRLSLQRGIDAARSDLTLAQRRVEFLESRNEDDRQAVQLVGAKSVQLEALEQEVQTNRELYHRFLSRMIETRSTAGLESANATVAEYATPALSPAKPNKAVIVALTFFGAFMASILVALIAGGLDDSIKHASDVEEKLGQRLLGIIPMHRKKRGRLARLFPFGKSAREKDDRMCTEAFTTARTNLLLDQIHMRGKIILLTSSVPGEGKSMSSIFLARSFAQMERVLLIDADIRRPSLGDALGLNKKLPGLTNFISGQNELQDCIHRNPANGLDVLCSGPATNQPLEMLSSMQFESALNDLAEKYDRIIIDSAPIEAVSDALLLSKLADRVIYVAKSHDTSMRLVSNGLDKLRGIGAPVVGMLLTQVDLQRLRVYGADYEFHSYYDYYGMSEPANGQILNVDRDVLRRNRTVKSSTSSETSPVDTA